MEDVRNLKIMAESTSRDYDNAILGVTQSGQGNFCRYSMAVPSYPLVLRTGHWRVHNCETIPVNCYSCRLTNASLPETASG